MLLEQEPSVAALNVDKQLSPTLLTIHGLEGLTLGSWVGDEPVHTEVMSWY